jgi:N-methylhydantoinase B
MHITEPGCRNNPVEILEAKAPMIIDRYGFRVDSGGAGKNRGGVGIERAYRFLAPTTAIVINYKTRTKPWSVGGGQVGVNNTVVLNEGTDQAEEVGFSTTHFDAGGKITNLTGGGGGWGNAFEREPERVLRDVREGYVSIGAAHRDYGVVIDPDTFTVDDAATEAARAGKNAG